MNNLGYERRRRKLAHLSEWSKHICLSMKIIDKVKINVK